jgi:hypothetical protein
MLITSILRWIFVISAIILADLILIGAVPQIVRESRKLIRRVKALTQLPLIVQIEQGERDVARVNAALDELPALEVRARAAIASIAATRFVPPAITGAMQFFGSHVSAFRREARR